MRIIGINTKCKSDMMQSALKKAGVRVTPFAVRWPRKKGPIGTRVDMAHGYAVSFVHDGRNAA